MDIGTLLRASTQASAGAADRAAVSIEGEDLLTYSELSARTSEHAGRLHNLGAAPGDRIGLLLHNCVEYWALYFAVVQLGCIAVRLNFRLNPEELRYAITDSGTSILCVQSELTTGIEPIRGDLPGVRFLGVPGARTLPEWCPDLYDLDPVATLCDAPLDPATPAMLMYTSGTTGRPKGALWSHGNTTWIAAMQAMKWDLGPGTVALTTGPMYHVGAFEDLLLPTLLVRGETIACRSTGFDIGRIMTLMANRGVTDAFLYPFMIYDLLRHPELSSTDLRSLRRIVTGGSAIATWAVERMAQVLPGVRLSCAYGLTEGGAMATVLDAEDLAANPDAVGRPLPGTELRVCGDDGTELPPGADGEVWIRSPSVCLGYWNKPEATAETFVDGWCRTGDLGHLTPGDQLLRITGRKKDMIKSGGENIYPAELENVLASHPDIVDCAFIAVPDARLEEAVCAVVVATPGATLSAEDVVAFCTDHLARYKRPRHVFLVDALPRNAAGKVLKVCLREQYAALGTS
jgi:fatty-acyl-CoA synthase